MSIAKDQIKQMLDSQPDNSSYDEILKGLAFKRMIDHSLADVKTGNTISNQEIEHKSIRGKNNMYQAMKFASFYLANPDGIYILNKGQATTSQYCSTHRLSTINK